MKFGFSARSYVASLPNCVSEIHGEIEAVVRGCKGASRIVVDDRSVTRTKKRIKSIESRDQIVASNEAWLEYSKESCFRTYNKKRIKTRRHGVSLSLSFSLCVHVVNESFDNVLFVSQYPFTVISSNLQ